MYFSPPIFLINVIFPFITSPNFNISALFPLSRSCLVLLLSEIKKKGLLCLWVYKGMYVVLFFVGRILLLGLFFGLFAGIPKCKAGLST